MPVKTPTLHAKLALPHLAYLRAIAQGVPAMDAARRYLGLVHGHEFAALHQWVIDRARAIARRAGLSAWRLLGVEIAAVAIGDGRPSVSEWAELQQLEGWRESEVLEMYEEAFAGVPIDPSLVRKAARANRLLKRRLDMIRQLEEAATTAASPGDSIDAWLGGAMVGHLTRAGITTLGSILDKLQTGGNWWKDIPAMGPGKAARLTAAVNSLFPPAADLVPKFYKNLPALVAGGNRAPARAGGLTASSDQEAIDIWVRSRARSLATAKVYRREAVRFSLFCAVERRVALSGAGVEDCRAYLDFLSNIPNSWISRRRAKPFAPGWAPFRGQLSTAAKKLSLTALQSMFSWLLNAGYLASNPWALVSRRLPDQHIVLPQSRAIPRAAWTAIVNHLADQTDEPPAQRLLFVLRFAVATGLRPAELLAAQLGHLTDAGESGIVLTVVGKGGKARLVPVPDSALLALDAYLDSRGIGRGQEQFKAVPLVASTLDAQAPISYRVFLR